jgi:hypothetical protein
MNAAITGHDLDAARASVANILKFDIITVTQDFDNEQQIKEISRSFVCECTIPIEYMYRTETPYSGHHHRSVPLSSSDDYLAHVNESSHKRNVHLCYQGLYGR